MPNSAFALKSIPSDFIVEEITPDRIVLARNTKYSFDAESKGKFLHFILQKENRDTHEVLDEIARALHAPREVLSIAGMKDKSAITVQMASAHRIRKEQLERLKIRGAKLIPLQYIDKKVFLGNLWGNRFTITARGISKTHSELRELILARVKDMSGVFPNYFGEQRFGDDNSTQKIGKLILKRDFKTASKECAKRYRECAAHLEKNPKYHLGAIKQLPLKLQKMFIHAVQAEIFNSALDELLKQKTIDKDANIPLPGYTFASRIFTSEIDRLIEEIMKKEGITPEMFRVKDLPEIASAGELRRAFEEFSDFAILATEADELNAGKTKAVVQFALKKGCYATVFLDWVFK
ncbi:MAG: tRNA pseudouridine(13) synthase TruD [Nanoarchaeota archaeon]|nr:tRNA pseudouridine(13) synthase TruD [Nanoarchaeota archaeon]MBU4300471.1 tRNA pseudouridine(13) synthase TruD [Nanoarchaeota archaeon]MBU4451951.1 tRNA pseudouridine(13) synthase TruD [Nanoarchaeota archaeon]MCG2724110.1 tRNA pseudouridine(13) synthase TruD [archaeon]